MKLIALSLFLLLSNLGFSQSFDSLLVRGKKEFGNQKYQDAISSLVLASSLQPDNSEVHYFLGYALDRHNSFDGTTIPGYKLSLAEKSSLEFEKVIKINPNYTGERAALDPHSKITSIWGTLALSYLYKGEIDSAKWAFKEGRRRGGFDDFYLGLSKSALELASNSSVIASYGDNNTFPVLYLQTIENYRRDVLLLDVGLINTVWYPNWLQKAGKIDFGLPVATLDTLQYIKWKDSIITITKPASIQSFSWTITPSYENEYLLRGDRLFLSFLQSNQFKRDTYFTKAFGDDALLSLRPYFLNSVFLDKLNYFGEEKVDLSKFKEHLSALYKLLNKININNRDELNFVESIRFIILDRIIDEYNANNIREARLMFHEMLERIPTDQFPLYPRTSKYIDDLKLSLP